MATRKGEIIIVDNKGAKVNIPYRKNDCMFSSQQILFLYKSFVVRCENDEKALKYFYINSKEIKELKRKENIEILPIDRKNQETVTIRDNAFVFLNDKKSTIASLLIHLRNSFVHNRIRLQKSGEIIMFDVIPMPYKSIKELERIKQRGEKRPQARVTMYSKFSSFSKFERVILSILDTQR